MFTLIVSSFVFRKVFYPVFHTVCTLNISKMNIGFIWIENKYLPHAEIYIYMQLCDRISLKKYTSCQMKVLFNELYFKKMKQNIVDWLYEIIIYISEKIMNSLELNLIYQLETFLKDLQIRNNWAIITGQIGTSFFLT